MSVSEHLSRNARQQLFESVALKVAEQVKADRQTQKKQGVKLSRGRAPILKAVAQLLNVSVPTCKAWRRGSWQSCNVNADKLLEKALELTPNQTRNILLEDLKNHEEAIRKYTDIPH